MAARILLALGLAVHVAAVAGLVAAVLLGGGWRPIGGAVVAVVAGAVWVLALYEHIGEQEARSQQPQPVPIRRQPAA